MKDSAVLRGGFLPGLDLVDCDLAMRFAAIGAIVAMSQEILSQDINEVSSQRR